MIVQCPTIVLNQATSSLRKTLFFVPSKADLSFLIPDINFNAGDVKITKNGGAEGNHLGTFAQVLDGSTGHGFYMYSWHATEIDTQGVNALRLANASWWPISFQVPIGDLWEDTIEAGVNMRQAMRAMSAMVAGLLGGLPVGPAVLKGLDQSTVRVQVTFDSNNNRTAISYTLGA